MATPLFYLFIFYAEGIVLGRFSISPILSLLLISSSAIPFFIFLNRYGKNSGRNLSILLTLMLASIFGYIHISYIKAYRPTNHISRLVTNKKVSLSGTLVKPPKIYGDGERLYIKSRFVEINGEKKETEGLVRLSIYRESSGLKYGDVVRIDKIRLRQPTNYKNEGGFDYKRFLRDRDIYLIGSIKNKSEITTLQSRSSPNIYSLIYNLKGKFTSFLNEALPPTERIIIMTMVFGEKGAINVAEREKFSKAGVSHILAVSGLHVGFISFIFYLILYRLFFQLFLKRKRRFLLLGYARRSAAAITIIPVVIYTIMSGGSASSFRAAVMISIYLLFVSLGREGDVLSSICLAAMIILLRNPTQLFDVGFQLSFAALCSIVYGYPLFTVRKNFRALQENNIWFRFWEWSSKGFVISLLAIAGTAPIVAYYFNIASLVAPISNIVAVPITAPLIVPSTLLASAFSLLSYRAASLLLVIPQSLAFILRQIVDTVIKFPFAYTHIARPAISFILLYYIFLFSLFHIRRGKGYKIVSAVSLSLLSLILVLSPLLRDRKERGILTSVFLDVGEGTSMFFRSPHGKTILIDGGKSFGDFNIGRLVVAPYLWQRGIKKIDYLIATHPDRDHIGGLTYIADEFEIGQYIDNGFKSRDRIIKRLRSIVRRKEIDYLIVKEGNRLKIDDATNILFLNPPPGIEGEDNDGSIVSRISYGDFSILSTGDISSKVEKKIALSRPKATIMEVPHHGSKYSSSINFIKSVSPEIAIISAGANNQYGHPNKKIVGRYKEEGSMVYITAIDGSIEITSDGKEYRLKHYANN